MTTSSIDSATVSRDPHVRPRRPHAVGPDRYDVVFYMPRIGSVLDDGGALPPGGAETQILMLAKELARRRLRVAIIVYRNPTELPSSVDGVALIVRPPYCKRGPVIGKLAEIWYIWQSLWRAPSQTIVNRCAGLELGLIALYARLTRRRLVFSSANVVDFDYAQLIPKRRNQFLYRFGVRSAAVIVVQTEEQVELCRKVFGRASTLIKSMAAKADPQKSAPEAFLWVGRIVSYKCPLQYIELAKALPDARFWMVGVPLPHLDGDRELAEQVMAAAAETPNLEMLAPRPHAEVGELMSRAVASVNTADFEGMPNVLLEAWSRGVPALALTHDPGEVIVTYGLGGFANGSMEELIALAERQWATRDDRDALSERCRTYIATHHDPTIVAAQWLDVVSSDAPASDIDNEFGVHS